MHVNTTPITVPPGAVISVDDLSDNANDDDIDDFDATTSHSPTLPEGPKTMRDARQWPITNAKCLMAGDTFCGHRWQGNARGMRVRSFYSGTLAPEQSLVMASAGWEKVGHPLSEPIDFASHCDKDPDCQAVAQSFSQPNGKHACTYPSLEACLTPEAATRLHESRSQAERLVSRLTPDTEVGKTPPKVSKADQESLGMQVLDVYMEALRDEHGDYKPSFKKRVECVAKTSELPRSSTCNGLPCSSPLFDDDRDPLDNYLRASVGCIYPLTNITVTFTGTCDAFGGVRDATNSNQSSHT